MWAKRSASALANLHMTDYLSESQRGALHMSFSKWKTQAEMPGALFVERAPLDPDESSTIELSTDFSKSSPVLPYKYILV